MADQPDQSVPIPTPAQTEGLDAVVQKWQRKLAKAAAEDEPTAPVVKPSEKDQHDANVQYRWCLQNISSHLFPGDKASLDTLPKTPGITQPKE